MTERQFFGCQGAWKPVRDDDRLLELLAFDQVANVSREPTCPGEGAVAGGCRRHSTRLRAGQARRRDDVEPFLRIHRSHLINLEYVTSIQRCDAARLEVVMKSGV